MSELKISYKVSEPSSGLINKGDRCLACGSKLTDPLSKFRGYGKGCWNKRAKVYIILEIPGGNDPMPTTAQ